MNPDPGGTGFEFMPQGCGIKKMEYWNIGGKKWKNLDF